jgi:GTP cyclohydrolase I
MPPATTTSDVQADTTQFLSSTADKLFASLRINDTPSSPLPKHDIAPPRLTALTPVTSRPGSPYTQQPPVDYDGLSWPSTFLPYPVKGATAANSEQVLEPKSVLKQPPKRRPSALRSSPAREYPALLPSHSGAPLIATRIRTLLECIGEDPTREGLLETPARYAKAMLHFTKGYEENLHTIINNAVFTEDHDELVIVKDIEIFSMCEHHLVPFTGRMHIGYIPSRKVLGLSKFARIAEMFARRLQLQERLTKQVAMAVEEILKPQGVAVVMESSHLCMVMRGVEKTSATTVTSCMTGIFRRSTRTREEFMHLVGSRK